ncbi:MAG TPA: glycogen debranching protein GlgX [Casimicrobiaceae bacterium]
MCEASGSMPNARARRIVVSGGSALPAGVHECCDGFNFSVFSRHAERIELLIYDRPEDAQPAITIPLDTARHRTGDIWHARVAGLAWGCAYAYRVHGPWAPESGQRFDPRRTLLDPYARAIVGTANWDFAALASTPVAAPASGDAADTAVSPKCLIADVRFDWDDDARPNRGWSETVIYETHVRGLTIHPSSAAANPGTFLGVIEKIPYFRELGVTVVELMPVQEFNERELARSDPTTGLALRNYWGYSPVAFFAPKEGYGSGRRPGAQVDEFKAMVRALHRARIEVILDVVFNHTAEADERGPTLSFRGLDNLVYYMLREDRQFYRDFTGCGNTFNCNHPVVHHFLIDCLRYWVTEMHVDGFRFDLAAVLGRDENGNLLANPALLEHIAEDPILRNVKLIAEAWDSAGAFQVGSFPGRRWAEWNARFRDDVRRFWRGDPGMTGALATRLCGSADLYQRSGKEPVNSVNFITCHDGFTLNDLVSYSRKRNEANGENGRDGADENFSASYGVEGFSADPAVEALRLRQIKNMLGTLLVSRGVPMLSGGDEFRRTQGGNNNAYCQDNETSWYDWRLLARNAETFAFCRQLIALRNRWPELRADSFYTEREIRWFGADGTLPDWDGPAGILGCAIAAADDRSEDPALCLCLLFNATAAQARFALPAQCARQRWSILVDTAQPSLGWTDRPASGNGRDVIDMVIEAHSMLVMGILRET